MQAFSVAYRDTITDDFMSYVTEMVTKRHGWELHLRQHREAKGISATQMADALGIERESVYRLERRPERANAAQQVVYAQMCQIEPGALWRPPEGILKAGKLAEGRITRFTDADLDDLAKLIQERNRKRRSPSHRNSLRY